MCWHSYPVLKTIKTAGLDRLHADGVLGLSPEGIQEVLRQPFEGYIIQDRIVSLALNDSTLTIGGFDKDKYSNGEMTWFEIGEDEWSIGLDSISVNEDQVR